MICLENLNIHDDSASLTTNRTLFNLMQRLSPHFSQQDSFFINVMRSDEARPHAMSGGIWGLCKTASQEWGKTFTKCMSLFVKNRSASAIAECIYNEIFFGAADLEVVYNQQDQRQIFVAIPQAANSQKPLDLQKTDVLVVTGGARGITGNCLVALAQASPCRLLLLGRSQILEDSDLIPLVSPDQIRKHLLQCAQSRGLQLSPRDLQTQVHAILNSREIQQTLLKLRNLGCEVTYAVVDCAKREDLREILRQTRQQWGPITGILHGAGVIHDRLLGELTSSQFESVFATKVTGALNLLAETTEDPLRLICFFSSVAARWGNRGQSAYAMANELLNKLAQYEAHQRPFCTVKSIDWGPWQGGMVNENLQKVFSERKIGLIPLAIGAKIFVRELNDASSTEIVLAQKPFLAFVPAKIPNLVLDWSLALHEFSLQDHTIKNSQVLPFAVILEWAQRIAKSLRRDLAIVSLNNCVCYKGIQIPSDLNSQTLAVRARIETMDEEQATVHLDFVSGERLYYKITAQLGLATDTAFEASLLFRPLPESTPFIYDGEVLFHGPRYQILQEIYALNDEGATAALTLDPASAQVMMIDGGIQLALLWLWKKLGRGSLPSSIKRLHFRKGAIPTQIVAHVRGTLKNNLCGDVDIFFYTPEAEFLAALEGLQLTSYFAKVFPEKPSLAMPLYH